MTLLLTTSLWLLFASITLANETTLFYYKADNKTADAVISAIESKRFQYAEVEAKLKKVAQSGKLRLLKKAVLTDKEKNITANSSTIKIEGEDVPMGLSIKASCFAMQGAYALNADAEYNVAVRANKYTSKRAIFDGLLPAKSWQLLAQWKNAKETEFILVQVSDKAVKPATIPANKKPTFSCKYHLIEINEKLLTNHLKSTKDAPYSTKEKALSTLLDKAKIIQTASFINGVGSKSIFSDSLIWIKNGDSTQLGLSIEQEIKGSRQGKKPSIHTVISWSDDKRFISTPDYSFGGNILLDEQVIAIFSPLTKPDKKARQLAVVMVLKNL